VAPLETVRPNLLPAESVSSNLAGVTAGSHGYIQRAASRAWINIGPFARGAVKVGGLVLGALAAALTIAAFTGPFWPTEPTFVPGAPSNSASNEVPFEITNPGSVFGLRNVRLQCYVLNQSRVPLTPVNPPKQLYGGVFFHDQRIESVGNIPAGASAQAQCKHRTEVPFQWRMRQGGDDVPTSGDAVMRATRVWVSAVYVVSFGAFSYQGEGTPQVFNWLELDPPRWVRGERNEMLSNLPDEAREPVYPWEDVRRTFEAGEQPPLE
jgi:hypothetical protein